MQYYRAIEKCASHLQISLFKRKKNGQLKLMKMENYTEITGQNAFFSSQLLFFAFKLVLRRFERFSFCLCE